ncbi:hypothetical protein K504DRAFT_456541 [Pleomassaria siparia CBS 279.74]|uniref:Uncharacterized protein n=1 Tax=Pleomassaria siparia CBS 279.74 TaxID=1314801 RepID=A0A6G1KN95_9PLEO|nr:hypothetical protein K504DRAFT_456541 [Pleomassaria siparia CBS 279.74]
MPDVQTHTVLSSSLIEGPECHRHAITSHSLPAPNISHGFPRVDIRQMSICSLPQNDHCTMPPPPPPPPFRTQYMAGYPDSECELRYMPVDYDMFLATLPPPPPPEPYTISPSSLKPPLNPDGPVSRAILNQRHLEEIQREEDQIRDIRDEYFGSRFSLKGLRKKVRDLRRELGSKEGIAISSLRNFVQGEGAQPLLDFEKQYAEVVELRDRLGSLEGKYEEEEERYDQLEWTYTRKEADYVARLTGQEKGPSTESRNVKAEDLALWALGPPESHDLSVDFEYDCPHSLNSSDFDEELSPETPKSLSQPFERQAIERAFETRFPRTSSKTGSHIQAPDKSCSPQSRARSDTDTSESRRAWTATRKRIDAWILDSLSCSSRQRLILRKVLSQEGLDDETWWNSVITSWSSECSSTPPEGTSDEEDVLSCAMVLSPIAPEPVSVSNGQAITERPEERPEVRSDVDSVAKTNSTSDATIAFSVPSTKAPCGVVLQHPTRPLSNDHEFDFRDIKETRKGSILSPAPLATQVKIPELVSPSRLPKCHDTFPTSYAENHPIKYCDHSKAMDNVVSLFEKHNAQHSEIKWADWSKARSVKHRSNPETTHLTPLPAGTRPRWKENQQLGSSRSVTRSTNIQCRTL